MRSRCLRLSDEVAGADSESLGDVGDQSGGDIALAGLIPPNLDARDTEQLPEGFTGQILGGADLLDPPGHQGAFARHAHSVSETETERKTFQTRTRKLALPLRTSVTDLLYPDWADYERWAAALGISFDKVLDEADVANPKAGTSRKTRSKMKGGYHDKYPVRASEQIRKVLTRYEKAARRPTEIGTLMVGVIEFRDLGAEIAVLEPSRFLRLLVALRDQAAAARGAVESPFFEIKPAEKK